MVEKSQVYSPAVIDAVAECLRTFYWYKPDLRSFLVRAGVPSTFVAQLPWDSYKRTIARTLLDGLARDAGRKVIIDKLIDAIVEQNETFPQLAKLEDGKAKVQEAFKALSTLKGMLGKASVVERADRARNENRTEAVRSAEVVRDRQAALAVLNSRFLSLCVATDAQRRGFDFQVLLRDLFALYDLDPAGAFAIPGEQTDGSIRFDGTVLLVEARWKTDRTPPGEVREFRTKVHDKLDNTLGILISMSGFGEEAINAASGGGRMVVILADGVDMAPIFSGNDDLVEVLRRKLRHAAERGIALFRQGHS